MQKSCVEVIERFRAALIAAGKSDLTIKTYVHELMKFHDWLEQNGGDIQDLTRYDVQSYITHLDAAGKSAATIEKTFAAIRVFALFLDRPDVVHQIRRPEFRKTRHVAPKSLERNEKNRLLREVERSGNLRDIAIVYMLLHTGLRVSELCALNRSDMEIRERSGSVTVRHGKGNVSRKVPLSAEARYHLRQYLNHRDDHHEALFLSNQNRRISVRTVQHMLSKYGVHPHALRHTFCREMIKAGNDIATVAELAGHADINVTRRYGKPTQAELEEAIERAFH